MGPYQPFRPAIQSALPRQLGRESGGDRWVSGAWPSQLPLRTAAPANARGRQAVRQCTGARPMVRCPRRRLHATTHHGSAACRTATRSITHFHSASICTRVNIVPTQPLRDQPRSEVGPALSDGQREHSRRVGHADPLSNPVVATGNQSKKRTTSVAVLEARGCCGSRTCTGVSLRHPVYGTDPPWAECGGLAHVRSTQRGCLAHAS